MPYADTQCMIDMWGEQELVELTNLHDPTAITINQDRLDKALERADSFINSFLSVRYDLPIANVPVVLESSAVDIARYFLESHEPRPDVRIRYEDVVTWLEKIVSGEVGLGLDDSGQEIVTASGVQGSSLNRVFTKTTLRRYTDIYRGRYY